MSLRDRSACDAGSRCHAGRVRATCRRLHPEPRQILPGRGTGWMGPLPPAEQAFHRRDMRWAFAVSPALDGHGPMAS
jgi:hypothetical protein